MIPHVAFLGPKGSFSHRVTKRLFPEGSQQLPCRNFNEVFETASNQGGFAVVPLENNTAGAVDPALDLLIKSDLAICAEYHLAVHHALVGMPCAPKQLDTLYAMHQPYHQCANFLKRQIPHAQWIQCSSSSESMEKSLTHGKGSAAIGHAKSALDMGLVVLERDIQNRQDNSTRFALLSSSPPYDGPLGHGSAKRSTIVFTLEDRPGTLLEILELFQSYQLNMSHIESRPSEDPAWNYNFLVTLESPQGDKNQLKQALAQVKAKAPWSRQLGTYSILFEPDEIK